MELFDQIEEAVRAIRKVTSRQPRVGIVLGSGLGALADEVTDAQRIAYPQIPHFAASTVPGHAGELVIGNLEGQDVVVMKGRVHYFEGYTMAQITFPVRVMRALGAEILVVTNACGGINPQLWPGDILLLRDHINFMGDNPLIGKNDERLGARFPQMSRVYTPELRELAHEVAKTKGVQLKDGVYLALSGPSYETPAEIHFFRQIGADAVGMSTVPEVIVASHSLMKVLGLACVTNILHQGPSDDTHEEVLQTAALTGPRMLSLLKAILSKLPVEKR